MMPASLDLAPSSRRRRSVGSDRCLMRSATGTANSSRQPGSPSMMAPCSKESRIFMVWGNVRATTVAPRSRPPWSTPPADARARSGFMAETPSTFQLTGRLASSDRVAMRSTSSSLKPFRHPGTMISSVVPSCSADRRAQRLDLGPAGRARRHRRRRRRRCGCGPGRWRSRGPPPRATGAAGPPWPPSARSAAVDPTAASPMTARRTAEWPTRKPAFTPICPSRRPSQSPNDVHDQSSCSQRRQGHPFDPGHHPGQVVGVGRSRRGQGEAAVAPDDRGHPVQGRGAGRRVPGQLGVVVGVEIDEAGGHVEAVGVDHVRAAVSSVAPTATTRPPVTATSARRAGRAGAVDHRAAADQQVEHGGVLLQCRDSRWRLVYGAGNRSTVRGRVKARMPSGPSSTP